MLTLKSCTLILFLNCNVIICSQYFGELSLVDSDPFLKYLPSHTAAAAYTLANYTVTGASWVSLRKNFNCSLYSEGVQDFKN